LEESVAIAESYSDRLALCWAQGLLAERDLLLGQPEAARTRLVPLLGRPDVEEFFVTRFLPVLAWAHLDLGEMAEAEQVVAQATRRMRANRIRLDLPDALRVRAMIALRQEHWRVAQQALEEGLALAQSMPYPYAAGRLLHVYGELHGQKGEPGPARERLEAALAIFQRLGARKDAERVEQALATLPNVPPRDAAGPARPSLPHTQRAVDGAPANKRLSRRQRQAWALEYLCTAGPLSPRAYATALAVSVDTALRDLQELVDRGLVQAAGTTKDRRYVRAGEDMAPAIHRTAP
jgi:tetratricopeptide (TPR) repeat protein